MEDPVVLLERNLYGHPLAGLLWERQFEKVLLKYGWEKVSNRECLFDNREKGPTLSVYVDDIKLAVALYFLMKDVVLGEPTLFFLTMFIWVALKENVRLARILLISIEVCSNSGFLQGLWTNDQKQKPRRNLIPKRFLHGPVTWKVMQRNAWKEIAN